MDIVILGEDSNVNKTKESYQILRQSLENLRAATFAEIEQVDEDEKEYEQAELQVIVELEKLLTESLEAFERIALLQHRGAEGISSQRLLNNVLKETIDKEFKPAIDAAIAEELEEADHATLLFQKLMIDLKLVSKMTALLSVMLALVLAVWLWRSFSAPMQQLIIGVRKAGKGELDQMIELTGRNEFTYLAKNFNDMTLELARQRQQILSAHAELENQVDMRTTELQQANQVLKQIDDGRRRFFADISHELRTPITAIRGEAEVAGRGRAKSADEYREALGRIVELSSQMGKLVEDLLFMARSEATEFRFELHPVPLDQLISELCDEASGLTRQRQHKLTIKLPEQPLVAEVDRLRLRQALLILIDNACRYSEAGSEIIVSLWAEADKAVIEVIDSGIGIPENELNLIFERFYQGGVARKYDSAGSGLGLPLAKSIIDAHYAKIAVASAPGEGTRVTLTLPAIHEE